MQRLQRPSPGAKRPRRADAGHPGRGRAVGFVCGAFLALAGPASSSDELTSDQAASALRKAVDFYRTQVSAEGGYLWRYSADLERQEGENKATAKTVWVQSPGTPTVGAAYLAAWRLTADEYFLDAAQETARALLRGQLRSGGWDYRIEFDPQQRRRYAYRVDPPGERQRNVTTLDDDNTQSALRFLMEVDQARDFKDESIHEAARYALDALVKAQYPNGAWPQRFDESPDPDAHPVKKASYPESWPREWPNTDYRSYYTFNDNAQADVIETMFQAAVLYGSDRYEAAARRGGDFILLAQMPDPQPAWAQQYDHDMHPAWARRFEPPSITGGESQGALQTLLMTYEKTGQKKYLAPVPSALDYLRKSQLPDGRLARFYELRTNRPLYFTKEYELTFEDDDLPTHYAFQVSSRLDRIEREYKRLLDQSAEQLAAERAAANRPRTRPVRLTNDLARQAREVVQALDARGAWVEPGRLRSCGDDDPAGQIIDMRTFVQNVDTLARFIAARRE